MTKCAETGGLAQFRNGHVQAFDNGFGGLKFVLMSHGAGGIHDDQKIVHLGFHFVQIKLGRSESTKIYRFLSGTSKQKQEGHHG